MKKPYSVILTESFKQMLPNYVGTFGDSAKDIGFDNPKRFEELLRYYIKVIESDIDKIFAIAAADISVYMKQYKVHVNQTIDEYKCIYFLGMAIAKQFETYETNKAYTISKIQLFSMVRMLDFRLDTLGAKRLQLTESLLDLIRQRNFDKNMGDTGCYLVYKCLGASAQEILNANGEA